MNGVGQRVHFDALPGILWSTDVELRIISCYGAGLSAFGARAEQLTGRRVAELFSDSGVSSPLLAAHHKALQGERTATQPKRPSHCIPLPAALLFCPVFCGLRRVGRRFRTREGPEVAFREEPPTAGFFYWAGDAGYWPNDSGVQVRGS